MKVIRNPQILYQAKWSVFEC